MRLAAFRSGWMSGLALLVLASCRPDGTVRPDHAQVTGPDVATAAEPPATRPPGVPHGASIDRVAVSADAKGALSVDKAGSMRLWPALDGSREPVHVPVRGARSMSLARRGEDWVVAAVDGAGGTHVMRIDPGGRLTRLADLDPVAPARDVAILPEVDRVLVLGEDHRVRLFTDGGEQLAVLEQRDFRPLRLLIGPRGHVLALSVSKRAGDRVQGQVQRLRVESQAVARAGAPLGFEAAVEPDAASFGMSPDGEAVAYLIREAGKWKAQIRVLDSGAAEAIDLDLQDAQTPGLGFVSANELFVTSRERGMAWLVDVRSKTRRPRVTAHQPSQPMPLAHQEGVQVVGYGTWLAVLPVAGSDDDRRVDFLGYRAFVAQGGAVSPSGRMLAWAVGGEILVEPADGSGELLRLRPDALFGTQFLAFIDDAHLVGVGNDGSVRVYRWQTGEVIDEVSVGTGLQAVHFDLARGFLVAHRMWGDMAVVALTRAHALEGPYLLADGSFRMGVLSGEPGMWTIDGAHKLRTYTLAELRGDLSQQAVIDRGETLSVPGGGQVMAVDGRGASYILVQDGIKQELRRLEGSQPPVTVSLGAHRVTQVILSPDGATLVAVADTGTVLAFDRRTLASKWSFTTNQMQAPPSFSPDGRRLLYMSGTGAVLLDASSGQTVRRRCGADFGRRGTAPFDAFSFQEIPSLCE